MQRTVVILKPRSRACGVDARFEAFIAERGLSVAATCQPEFSETTMRRFAPHVKEAHLPVLLPYLNEERNDAYLVEGEGAIEACLELRDAIRHELATVQPYTLIHASDSKEAAEREISVLWTKWDRIGTSC